LDHLRADLLNFNDAADLNLFEPAFSILYTVIRVPVKTILLDEDYLSGDGVDGGLRRRGNY